MLEKHTEVTIGFEISKVNKLIIPCRAGLLMDNSTKHECLNCIYPVHIQTSVRLLFTEEYNNFHSIWIALVFINNVERFTDTGGLERLHHLT